MTRLKKLIIFSFFSVAMFVTLGWWAQSGGRSGGTDLYYQINKFSTVAQIAQSYYIEDVEWDKVFEAAIKGMLSELDPHSVYISKEATTRNNEEFEGKYFGIGIEFDIIDDFLTVIQVMPGSPSEKAGLLGNDKIMYIDGESAIGISRSDVPKRLKGPKGTVVEVQVKREDEEKLLTFEIVRGEIPTFSVMTYFMLDDKTGYMDLSQFIKTSSEEVEEALQYLEANGMKQLVFDLRGNPGGLLDQAVRIASKFLKGRKKVVYTKGRIASFDEEYFTDTFERVSNIRDYPVIVMLDRGSASASEIVSGALQDYDRGLIIGERSFGKGLVQKPWRLKDGSSFRMTISRYYTPTGRLIQRDYKGKKSKEYYREIYEDTARYNEEKNLGEEFETLFMKRKVYGGGGINPDIHLTSESKKFKNVELMNKLRNKRVYFELAVSHADEYQKEYRSKKKFMREFKFTNTNALIAAAKEKEIELSTEDIEKDKHFINLLVKANIAKQIWGNKAYYEVFVRDNDPLLNDVLQYFPKAEEMVVR